MKDLSFRAAEMQQGARGDWRPPMVVPLPALSCLLFRRILVHSTRVSSDNILTVSYFTVIVMHSVNKSVLIPSASRFVYPNSTVPVSYGGLSRLVARRPIRNEERRASFLVKYVCSIDAQAEPDTVSPSNELISMRFSEAPSDTRRPKSLVVLSDGAMPHRDEVRRETLCIDWLRRRALHSLTPLLSSCCHPSIGSLWSVGDRRVESRIMWNTVPPLRLRRPPFESSLVAPVVVVLLLLASLCRTEAAFSSRIATTVGGHDLSVAHRNNRNGGEGTILSRSLPSPIRRRTEDLSCLHLWGQGPGRGWQSLVRSPSAADDDIDDGATEAATAVFLAVVPQSQGIGLLPRALSSFRRHWPRRTSSLPPPRLHTAATTRTNKTILKLAIAALRRKIATFLLATAALLWLTFLPGVVNSAGAATRTLPTPGMAMIRAPSTKKVTVAAYPADPPTTSAAPKPHGAVVVFVGSAALTASAVNVFPSTRRFVRSYAASKASTSKPTQVVTDVPKATNTNSTSTSKVDTAQTDQIFVREVLNRVQMASREGGGATSGLRRTKPVPTTMTEGTTDGTVKAQSGDGSVRMVAATVEARPLPTSSQSQPLPGSSSSHAGRNHAPPTVVQSLQSVSGKSVEDGLLPHGLLTSADATPAVSDDEDQTVSAEQEEEEEAPQALTTPPTDPVLDAAILETESGALAHPTEPVLVSTPAIVEPAAMASVLVAAAYIDDEEDVDLVGAALGAEAEFDVDALLLSPLREFPPAGTEPIAEVMTDVSTAIDVVSRSAESESVGDILAVLETPSKSHLSSPYLELLEHPSAHEVATPAPTDAEEPELVEASTPGLPMQLHETELEMEISLQSDIAYTVNVETTEELHPSIADADPAIAIADPEQIVSTSVHTGPFTDETGDTESLAGDAGLPTETLDAIEATTAERPALTSPEGGTAAGKSYESPVDSFPAWIREKVRSKRQQQQLEQPLMQLDQSESQVTATATLTKPETSPLSLATVGTSITQKTRAKLEASLLLPKIVAASHADRYKRARQQPKSPTEEDALASKYAAIPTLEERAYTILKDLGMLETVVVE